MSALLRLFRYVAPYRLRFIGAIVAMLVYAAASAAVLYLIKPILDSVLPHGQKLPRVITEIIGFYLLKGIGAYFSAYLMSDDLVNHLRYYAELGVDGVSRDPAWRARADRADVSAPSEEAEGGHAVGSGIVPDESAAPTVIQVVRSRADALAAIRADIGDCTRCKLHSGRTNLVYGVGSPDATLMFIGEGPGADEDLQGIPFVGRAGQLLTQIIKAMGFERDEVYIANVVKCRPPNNRNPEPDEIERCEPFLMTRKACGK